MCREYGSVTRNDYRNCGNNVLNGHINGENYGDDGGHVWENRGFQKRS